MNEQSLQANYKQPSGPGIQATLILEREEPAAYVGVMSKANMVRYMMAELYGASVPPDINCGLTDDIVIYAYPAPPDLPFRIRASYGQLSAPIVQDAVIEETMNFSLTKTARLDYAAAEILSADPAGDFCNTGGGIVSPPELTISGNQVTIPSKMYGAIKIRYRVRRYRYLLDITPREDVTENFLSSVVWASWDGGVTWEIIDPPPGAEELVKSGADCGRSGTGSITGPGEDPYQPDDTHANRKIRKDYCTQAVLSDNTYAS